MLWLVIVLALIAALAVTALVVVARRGLAEPPPVDPADPAVQAALAAMATQTGNRPRRFISVEILNPIELAANRGRMLGLAGTLAPGLTRRLVHDRIVRQMRELFAEHGVVAEVHVHSVHHVVESPITVAAQGRHEIDLGSGMVDDIDAETGDDDANGVDAPTDVGQRPVQ